MNTVEVTFKPVSDSSFEGYFDDEPDEAEVQHNGIMPYNAVREAVQRYVDQLLSDQKTIEL